MTKFALLFITHILILQTSYIVGKPGALEETPVPCTIWKGICYYNSSAQYRPAPAKFLPRDMNTSLCSHLTFCYAKISNNKLIAGDPGDQQLYEEFNNHKERSPNLKTLLAVGGNKFDTQTMTAMLSTLDNRQSFISSSIDFMRENNFDGLDLHCDVVEKSMKKAFTLLIKEITLAFFEEGETTDLGKLLLMVSVHSKVEKINCDLKMIHPEVDFVHLKAFEFHTSAENVTALISPLFQGSADQGTNVKLNIDYSTKYMTSNGVPKMKLIIGMPMYGLGYTLSDIKQHNLGAPVTGPSVQGMYTRQPGFLSYYEICLLLKNTDVKTVFLVEQMGSYLYWGNQWVSYEDKNSLTKKIEFLKTNGYGGWSAWDVSLDDFQDLCRKGQYPLLKTFRESCPGIIAQPTSTQAKTLSSTTINQLGPKTKKPKIDVVSRTTILDADTSTINTMPPAITKIWEDHDGE